ncbi:hypothetical protein SLA2020_281590 [Shorea laevis]
MLSRFSRAITDGTGFIFQRCRGFKFEDILSRWKNIPSNSHKKCLCLCCSFRFHKRFQSPEDKGPLVADEIPDAIRCAELTVKIPWEFGAQNQSEEGGDRGTCIFSIFSAVVRSKV